ncbi:peptidylprolyl isomerase [Microbacterium sp. GXS0129]|jgi:peptidyl-prolyl cis-trans isomerase B (cyclophilin B)|uniref:peptidylprolyl isomerase n=1 Tax=Microbacterium sp. GXS0129 TaxID=3377836 RepID=UPI00383AC4D7
MRKRLLVLPVVAVLLAGLAACSTNSAPEAKPAASASANDSASASAAATPSGTCSYPASGTPAKPASAPSSEPELAKTATLTTSAGEITITLDGDKTPCTVNSFVSLITQGYFADTKCHRLTTQGIFVLQCGDPSGTGAGGPGYSFADETSPDMSYPTGTVAMANAGPDTNGSQFFLVYDDSTGLPPDYTVFGHMDEASVAVVQAIAAKGVAGGRQDGAPAETVTITSATTAQ